VTIHEARALPIAAEDEAGLPGPRPGEPDRIRTGTGAFRALHHREFRLLWSAYALGDLGFWISYISLQWAMTRATGSDGFWLGALFFCNFVPMLLLAPIAGVTADRLDRKRVLMATRGGVAVVATALAVLMAIDADAPGVLVAFGAGFGALFAFMAPASQALVANSVPEADLASAVSVQSAGTNLWRITGPAIAAPILAAWGAGASFTLYAVTSAVFVLLLARLRLTPRVPYAEEGGVWSRWREGLRHARDRPPALAALLTMTVFSVFGAAHVVLFPVFATDVFDRSATAFTALVSASGVGAVFGALGTARRPAVTLTAAAGWLVGFAVAALAFSLSRSWPLSLVLAAAVGACYFSVTTTINTLLHLLADDDRRGRIMGLFTVTWAGAIPFGGLWMGAVAELVSAPVAMGAGALVCGAYGLAVLVRARTSAVRTPAAT